MRTCNILLYAVFSTSLVFLYFRDLSALSIFHFSAALAPLFPAIGVKSSGRPLIVFLFFLDYLSLPLEFQQIRRILGKFPQKLSKISLFGQI